MKLVSHRSDIPLMLVRIRSSPRTLLNFELCEDQYFYWYEIAVNSNSQTFKKSRTSLKIGVRDSVSKFMARTLLKSLITKIDNQVQFDKALSDASNVIFKSLVVVTWGLSKWTKEKINNFCLLIVASAILSIHQVMRA